MVYGVSKGAAPLWLIRAFLAMRALREEKALMSYGFSLESLQGVRLQLEAPAFLFRLLG